MYTYIYIQRMSKVTLKIENINCGLNNEIFNIYDPQMNYYSKYWRTSRNKNYTYKQMEKQAIKFNKQFTG